MNTIQLFYLFIMAVLSVIVVEGFKKICRPENQVLRGFIYSVFAIVPCFLSGLLVTKCTGKQPLDWFESVANTCIIYVIQYVFGANLIAKMKEVFEKKLNNI